MTPIRPGIPGERPFWNRASGQFTYVPAFDIPESEGAACYRFALKNVISERVYLADQAKPFEPIYELWRQIPTGGYEMTVSPIDAAGNEIGEPFSRGFVRQPCFHGPYLPPRRSYREAGFLGLAHVFKAEFVRKIHASKKIDPAYEPYLSYPSKMVAAVIHALCVYADLSARDHDLALAMAESAAEGLIATNVPDGRRLARLPMTYLGENFAAKGRNHLIMMNYPLSAALAYLALFDRTGREKYKAEALAVLKTFAAIQEKDGTWFLIYDSEKGTPATENRLLAYSFLILADKVRGMGIADFDAARQKCLDAFLDGPVKTFDWSGQFEDTPPMSPYANLAKDMAIHFACYLAEHPEIVPNPDSIVGEIVRFADDQFFLWGPAHVPEEWHLRSAPNVARELIYPVGLEQYNGMYAVNDSSGDGINGFMTMFRLTRNPLWLAKACALANVLTIAQYDDGEIPSGLDNFAALGTWINGQISSALTLLELARCCEGPIEGHYRNIYEF